MRRTVRLAVTPPFAFGLALRYLAASPSAVVEQVEDGEYMRPVRLGGRWLLLRVRDGAIPGRALRVTLEGNRVRTADLEAAAALVARVFATPEDVRPLLRSLRSSPPLAPLARRCRGLRVILIGDPFEALIWAVIGQQINIAFAAKLKGALLERFGGSLAMGGRRYPLFPTPERLARLRRADLRPLQFSRQKADYIIGLSQAVARGSLDFASLGGLPTAEVVARLTAFRGIGRWTAEYLLLRGLGDRDALPAADGGLRRIVGEEFGLDRLATEEEVRAIAAPLAGWRGYLAFYWWFTLQERQRSRAGPPRSPAPSKPSTTGSGSRTRTSRPWKPPARER